MGLADCIFRKTSEQAKLPNAYDKNKVIAQNDIIRETLQIIRKRARPRKKRNQP